MIEINLLPDIKLEFIKAQKIRSKVIFGSIVIGIISIGVVVVLAVYIFAFKSVRGKLDEDAINKKSAELSKVEDLPKILTIQNQLSKISELNSDKKIDSRLFDLLAVIIPPAPNSVQISDLIINPENTTITLNGQAENSYAALEVFKKIIEGTTIKYTDSSNEKQEILLATSISTGNSSYGEDSSGKKVLRFTLSFVYAPELFAQKTADMTVQRTNSGNVTDSYLSMPKIFTDRAKD